MDLKEDERELFAVLVGPRIQELTPDGDDVTGFGSKGFGGNPDRCDPNLPLRSKTSNGRSSSVAETSFRCAHKGSDPR